MFAYEFSADLVQELSEIPAAYQEAFQHAIEQELQEGEHDRTDSDRLRYLRHRRTAFQQGSYLRPDGHPGLVALSAEALYEQGFGDLAHPAAVGADGTSQRRRTLLKAAGLLCLVALFLLWAVRSRAERLQRTSEPVATAAPAVDPDQPSTLPASAIPDVAGAEETLRTIGGLGGALTLGRPSALTLTYLGTDEVVALPIDPSRPTTRGELRYSEAQMVSDTPVAVWLFGTVVNYAIGVPDGMVRALQEGDRLTITTDTGAALHFTVREQWQGATHEASQWLSQTRTGVTLFSLPAVAEKAVAFVFASYDLTYEQTTLTPLHQVGDTVALSQHSTFEITAHRYDQTVTGNLQVTLQGSASVGERAAQPLWLALSARWGQSDAIALPIAADGSWSAIFTLPAAAVGAPLFAELRLLPSDVVTVALGDVPELISLLQSSLDEAVWLPDSQTISVTLTVRNPTRSTLYLSPDLFTLVQSQGGDATDPTQPAHVLMTQPAHDARQLTRVLPQMSTQPRLLLPGETHTVSTAFLPLWSSIQLHVGRDRWEISNIPVDSK